MIEMSEIDVNQLVTQMRLLAAQAKVGGPTEAGNTSNTDFSTVFKQTVDGVNERQQKAREMATALDAGTGEASLAEVMISMQKASVSFQAITQVRNKLVSAYQEIMSMQV
jgi:flagellar hook-basal body complex protein FliE